MTRGSSASVLRTGRNERKWERANRKKEKTISFALRILRKLNRSLTHMIRRDDVEPTCRLVDLPDTSFLIPLLFLFPLWISPSILNLAYNSRRQSFARTYPDCSSDPRRGEVLSERDQGRFEFCESERKKRGGTKVRFVASFEGRERETRRDIPFCNSIQGGAAS